jgi:hypothetical protein
MISVFKRVAISDLSKRRRGKHHDLVGGILQELETLPATSAIQVPIKDIGGVTVVNLRSAVHRATVSRGLEVETASDKDHLYIWKASGNGRRRRRS